MLHSVCTVHNYTELEHIAPEWVSGPYTQWPPAKINTNSLYRQICDVEVDNIDLARELVCKWQKMLQDAGFNFTMAVLEDLSC